jgi:ubiquitin-like 1-activating enzyme E1 B
MCCTNVHSLERLSQRLQSLKSSGGEGAADPIITFDKDDEDTLDFVTASANLRSIVFGIEAKSRFDIKQMAGNIIPAIATTNAIVAGLCILQSFKVLRGDYAGTKEVSDASIFQASMHLTLIGLSFAICSSTTSLVRQIP